MRAVEILDNLGIVKQGELNFRRIGWLMMVIAGLLILRATTTGISGQSLSILERELINEYRYTLYKAYGLYDERPTGTMPEPTGKNFPYKELQDLKVEFSNVSMSAPNTNWSVLEDVMMRVDYTLSANGELQTDAKNVYFWVPGSGNGVVRRSGAFQYYLHFLL